MRLQGRTAIITGANQGFGLEVARAFIKEGANVVICARNKKLLEDAEEELQELTASLSSRLGCRDPGHRDVNISELNETRPRNKCGVTELIGQ